MRAAVLDRGDQIVELRVGHVQFVAERVDDERVLLAARHADGLRSAPRERQQLCLTEPRRPSRGREVSDAEGPLGVGLVDDEHLGALVVPLVRTRRKNAFHCYPLPNQTLGRCSAPSSKIHGRHHLSKAELGFHVPFDSPLHNLFRHCLRQDIGIAEFLQDGKDRLVSSRVKLVDYSRRRVLGTERSK